MKKIVISVVFAALLISVLVTVAFAASVDVTVELSTGQELISIYDNFYLPSSSDITSVKIRFVGGTENVTYGDGIELNDGDTIDLTSFKTTDKYHNECYVVTFESGGEEKAYTFYKADSLSAVYINTSIGIDNFKIKQQKDNFTKVSISSIAETLDIKRDKVEDSMEKLEENNIIERGKNDTVKKGYRFTF